VKGFTIAFSEVGFRAENRLTLQAGKYSKI